jgi:CBS domain-containing protein
MVKCTECKSELPANAKFCHICGTQVGTKKDVFQVSAETLIAKVKEILKDPRVKRIVIKDDEGKVLISMPVTWGAAGAVATVALAPLLAAIGVLAAIVTKCTVEVERIERP